MIYNKDDYKYEYTTSGGTDEPTFPSDEKYDTPYPTQTMSDQNERGGGPTTSKDQIDPRTLEMIKSGIENLKKGNVSGPVDLEEDFPGLFEDQD
jgi:hypothetical protein